jgi:hypothetical protein
MGQRDLYPFTLTGPVIEKMRFVHELIAGATPEPAAPEPAGS